MQPFARIRLENDEDHTNDAVVVVVVDDDDDDDDDDPSISSRCSANAGVDRTIEA